MAGMTDDEFHDDVNNSSQEYMHREAPEHIAGKQFRLSYACLACNMVHIRRGSFLQCMNSATGLMVMGCPSVSVENEAFALEMDMRHADDTVFDVPDGKPHTN